MKGRIGLIVIVLGLVSGFAYVRAAPERPAVPALPGNAKPLVSGEFLSGTIWEKPILHAPPNSGYSPAAGARVDVYENFIVITDAAGAVACADIAQHIIMVPACDPFVAPLVYSIPIQLLAYLTAVQKGTDVDQPRNLAKSVTVE